MTIDDTDDFAVDTDLEERMIELLRNTNEGKRELSNLQKKQEYKEVHVEIHPFSDKEKKKLIALKKYVEKESITKSMNYQKCLKCKNWRFYVGAEHHCKKIKRKERVSLYEKRIKCPYFIKGMGRYF